MSRILHIELEKQIYIQQLEAFVVPGKEDYVCLLKKTLYDLKQSPRQWYKHLDSFMIDYGYFIVIMIIVIVIKGSMIVHLSIY